MPKPTLRRRPFSGFINAYAAPLLALAVITLLAPNVNAAQITISSADGQPLENAVVEIYYTSEASNPPQEESIFQRDAAFHPKVLTVPTYSFSPAKTFDLNLYLQETPPPVHFDQSGIVVLGCNIHDHMQAFIVVSDAPYSAKTGAEGVLTLPELPSGEHRVRVWHPLLDDSQQVWWEGVITDNDQLNVSLKLNALPPPAPTLSPLQQRFKDAT